MIRQTKFFQLNCAMPKLTLCLFALHCLLACCFSESIPCNLRDTKFGKVCVCNADTCDYLVNPKPGESNEFNIVSSSKAGLRFSLQNGSFQQEEPIIVSDYKKPLPKYAFKSAAEYPEEEMPLTLTVAEGRAFLQFANWRNRTEHSIKRVELRIDRSKQYQRIVGFGGALTGSVSHILEHMTQPLQDHVYRSYYHADGIGFNIVRMSIAGSDFDLEPWAYNEQPRNDAQLSNFTQLDPRDELKVQQLQRLQQVAELDELKIMAAAWSSPTWMKSNEAWTGFSFLKPEYYQTWADYHLRYLELMAAKNVSLWAISTGNEPLNGVIGWLFIHFMSLGWTPTNQAIWLSENLGPTIKNSKFKNVLIFGNDDQRYTYPAWFNKMKSSRADSIDYLDGLAVHWYWDNVFGPSLTDETHEQMPDKLLFNTESSVGDKPWQTHGPELGSWERGEQYIRAFLQDLQHHFNGWIDWNLILNELGGPNYVKNFVDAPVIVNTTNYAEFYKQPIYYGMGHFTKFITPNSIRINTRVSDFDVDAVGFLRPDSTLAIIIFNGGAVPVDVLVNDSVRGNAVINIPARSIHTLLYR